MSLHFFPTENASEESQYDGRCLINFASVGTGVSDFSTDCWQILRIFKSNRILFAPVIHSYENFEYLSYFTLKRRANNLSFTPESWLRWWLTGLKCSKTDYWMLGSNFREWKLAWHGRLSVFLKPDFCELVQCSLGILVNYDRFALLRQVWESRQSFQLLPGAAWKMHVSVHFSFVKELTYWRRRLSSI